MLLLRLTHRIVVIVASIILAGIVEPGAQRTRPSGGTRRPSDWSIFVYMNAKNNLEPDALRNFRQIAAVDLGTRVNVIVMFGRPKKNYDDGEEKWSGVLQYHMKKGIRPVIADSDCGSTNCSNAKPRNLDMGSQSTLQEFLTDGRKQYPANHYAVVIWDHGQGWRFKRADDVAVRKAATRASTTPSGPPKPGASFRSASYDEDSGHTMFNKYIEEAIRGGFSDKRLDVLGFDACLMAMIETAYAMRDVAEALVGSEELEPGPGWNYTKWLNAVVQEIPATSKAMADRIVRAYRDEYGDTDKTTLSAMDLSKARDTATAISDLSKLLMAEIGQHKQALGTARRRCGPYGAAAQLRSSIDAIRFLKELSSADADARLKQAADRAAGMLEELVTANYASTLEMPLGSNGVAIFFPASKRDFMRDPDHDAYTRSNRVAPVEFVNDSDWSLFISKYLQLN